MAKAGIPRGAILLLAAFFWVFGAARAQKIEWDKAASEKVVNLGVSPEAGKASHKQIQLHCWTFPTFQIKELVDPEEEGTQWGTILALRSGEQPSCYAAHNPTELFIDEKGWWGFYGVKGKFVFLTAADGTDDGMHFRILDANTAKILFEDSADLRKQHIELARAMDGRLALHYLRVVAADCSIAKDGVKC